MLLPFDVLALAFCPTGPGGGIDNSCSSAGPGSGGGYQYQHVTQLRVNQWPEADRRALRALQSRLSRAVGEQAKDAVRAQIIALRNRVNSIHDALRSALNQPANVAQQAAAHQSAAAAAKAAKKAATQAEALQQLKMLTAPQSYEKVAPEFQRRVEQILNAKGNTVQQQQTYDVQAEALNATMQRLYPGLGVNKYGEALAQTAGFDDTAAEALGSTDAVNVFVSATSSQVIGDYVGVNIAHGGMSLNRMIRQNAEGKTVVKNSLFTLPKDKQKDGIGVRIFSNQVANLSNSKAEYIATDAARGGSFVGYKVWPKFGYDTDYLNTSTAPEGVGQKAHTRDDGRWIGALQATLSTPAGQDWWAKKGDSISVQFYLDDKKYVSQSVLRAYRERKLAEVQKAAGKVELAFCPTGPGGGIDPTCSPSNAGTGSSAAPTLKKATGSKNWPDAARKKLRALQSRLSRATTPEAKALVVKAINALIDEQNGVKAETAPTPAAVKTHDAALAVVDSKISETLKTQGQSTLTSLTQAQKDAVWYYTGSGYGSLNDGLRNNKGSLATATTNFKKTVTDLDAALTKTKTTEDYVMTRAVGPNTQKTWVKDYVHTEHGYLSMSARTPAASGPMGTGWDKVNRCIITVPKGTPGMYVGGFSIHTGENEFIGARGLKLRVTHRRNGVSREEARAALMPNKTNWQNSLKKEKYNLIYMTIEQ